MTPGLKTTEFYLAAIATFIGLLMTSGMFADGSTAMRIAGVAAMALASIGYSTSRGTAKSAASPTVQTAQGNIVNPPPPPASGDTP